MSDVLAEILAGTRRRVDGRLAERRGAFRDALTAPGLSVIAEHKRASPSAGVIRADLSLAEVIGAYERGGARALSILTEPDRFAGSLDDLRDARSLTGLPLLRKDFIVTEYQVAEAAIAGADAILLIVAALASERLRALLALAESLGLDALVEVHDRAELEIALTAGAKIVGINNRNLATLDVSLQTTYELLPMIPAGVLRVAESGFSTREQLDALAAAGVDAVLIGEALMRAVDPEVACRRLTA
jgi:indole-3-glycerol phosphate synthase